KNQTKTWHYILAPAPLGLSKIKGLCHAPRAQAQTVEDGHGSIQPQRFGLIKWRHLVENFFCSIKAFLRIATPPSSLQAQCKQALHVNVVILLLCVCFLRFNDTGPQGDLRTRLPPDEYRAVRSAPRVALPRFSWIAKAGVTWRCSSRRRRRRPAGRPTLRPS